MICTKCGAEIPNDSAFCQICGNPVMDSDDNKIIAGGLKNTQSNEKTEAGGNEVHKTEENAASEPKGDNVSEPEKQDPGVQIEKETRAPIDGGQNNGAVNNVPPAQNVNQDQAQFTAQANNVNQPQGYASNQAQQGQFPRQGQFVRQQMPYYQSAPQRGGGFVPVKKAFPKKVWIIAIAAAAAIIALVLFLYFKPTVVSLNKYITITTTGYDSVGKASAKFDSEQFRRDYSGKIKAKKTFNDYIRQEMGSIFSLNLTSIDSMVMEFLEDQISGSLDKTSKLSNGDQINYSWKCNDAVIEKFFKVKLNYSDINYTVENLKPVEKKDAFAGISLSFSGIAPTGRIDNVINPDGLSLKYSKSDGLSNGDKIIVTVSIGSEESFITQHGWLPKERTKEYEVSGLSSYVRTISDVNENTLEAMKKEAGDQIASYIARGYASTTVTEGLAYAGSYLLTSKKPGSSGTYNHFYIVYSARISNTNNTFETATVYYPIRFDNLLINGNGVVSYKSVSSVIGRSTLNSNGFGSWSTNGYTNGSTMYSEIIKGNRNNYNYEVSPELAQFGS